MRININDNDANQDNSVVWVNPFLKTIKGKLLLAICIIGVIAIIILCVDLKQFYSNNKTICLLLIFLDLISIVHVIVNYIISKIYAYKIEKENTSENEKHDYEYYREILDETSSGVLSFVYNKRINYKDILIATLLSLEKGKIIKLDYNNKYIEILLTKSDKLSEYEKYILNLLRFESKNGILQFSVLGKIITNENFKINIKELIKKSAKEKGYYTTNNFTPNIVAYILLVDVCIMFIRVFLFDIDDGFTLYLSNAFVLFFLSYIANIKTYIRTKEGKLLSDRLNGLKNFLIEYSLINERQIEEILVWDYYMIYAIIFDLKGNLDKDVKELYDALSEKT